MNEYNVHRHSLFVNVVPKYTQESVEILIGSGTVLIPEFYQSAEITFGETTENVTIDNKAFTISDSGYSGLATINYYAKDICRQFLFSLYVSGVSQVQTFIARIITKVSGSAFGSSLKNMAALVYIKEKSNTWRFESLKNSTSTILLNFNLRGVAGCLKKAASVVKINFEMSKTISSIKVLNANFGFLVSGDADLTVATYTPLSNFSLNTLDELIGSTLEEMMYTEI